MKAVHVLALALAACVPLLWPSECHASGASRSKGKAEVTPLITITLKNVTQVSAGDHHTCAVTKWGECFCWGEDPPSSKTGRHNNLVPERMPHVSDVAEVHVGRHSTLVRSRAGQIRLWVLDRFTTEPVRDAIQGTLGMLFQLAIRSSGEVVRWGHPVGAFQGLFQATRTPEVVPGISDGKMVTVGGDHLCVLLNSGKVMCWGGNSVGQLGNGLRPSKTPIEVKGLSDAIQVSAGQYSTCAVRKSGEVRCWGALAAPVFSDAVQVSVASGWESRACAVRRNGEVVCWGTAGALETVAGLTDVVQVSLGGGHACAVRQTGEVACWGRNDVGQLGDGTQKDRAPPTVVLPSEN